MQWEILARAFKALPLVACMSLAGCKPPPSVIANQFDEDINYTITFSDAGCVSGYGTIHSRNVLITDCKLSSVDFFNYKTSSGKSCNVDGTVFRSSIHVVKDNNVYGDSHLQVDVPSLKCK